MERRIRIGVDVGGTFTDFVLVDEHRDLIFTGKRLTSAADPSVAITAGIERLLSEAQTPIAALHSIVHGTTLIANTVIERKGAKIGLVTTAGFRDAIEMGKEIRYDLYDLFLQRPETLAPRHLRREVNERVDAAGTVLMPFDADEFRTTVRALVADGIEAIAVAFIHSYRNPTHERAAKAILAAEFPHLPVTISADVAPEIREFERTSTAVCNAYVQPLMRRYLARLQAELQRMGLQGSLYIMLSGGGITTVRAAEEFPVRIIESGPAAGAIAASFYSELTHTDHLIAFDMGGTTAKMCLVEDGRPEHAHEFEAGRVRRFRKGSGIPLKVPVIDLIEIGAGGGSIAWIDRMGLLKVGPKSAGSDPGPVCYGRGGTQPTVTDADLLLGYLSPDFFLGGEMPLELAAVERVIEAELARPLGLSVIEAAAGIHSIVNENMAAATRMYIAEKGRDPRRYAMLAFGGAGPVHAYQLAKLLKLKRIICPLGAGVMSALGFLVAAPAIDLVRSYVTRLTDIDWRHLNVLYTEMAQEARSLLKEAGADDASISIRRHADMRYVGQGFEIDVPLPDGALSAQSAAQMRDAFLNSYRSLFDREIREVPTEALTWRLSATAPVPNVTLNFAGQRIDSGPRRKGTRKVYFPGTGFVDCPVYNRYALMPGTSLHGPAVIEERESTVVAGPDARFFVDDHLNLIVDIDAPGAARRG
jgi:N-methylhydantoinase A